MDFVFYINMSKRKGTNAERELIKLFWLVGWAAVRVAGSGSMQFPSPDLLVGNKIRRLAIEVKITKEEKKYFSKEDVKQLLVFSSFFGAESWLAIKFPHSRWVFVNPEDLEKTRGNFVFKSGSHKGLSFDDLTEAT